MVNWLKKQNWYWSLYFEWSINWRWLPVPRLKTWHILIFEGAEPPPAQPGFRQKIKYLPKPKSVGGLGYVPLP